MAATFALGCIVAAATRAEAGLVVSVEAPGVMSSKVSGITTETFDGLPPGIASSLDTAVGTLASRGRFAILNADSYGGADAGGEYISLGAQSGSPAPMTLTFASPQAYFGMWWSAADAYNEITFYSGQQALGSFNSPFVLDALNALPDGRKYYGNPNGWGDASEPFAYLNFFGTGGTTITSVVFANSGTTATGFESDNWSIASVAPSTIRGTIIAGAIVPEPSSLVLAGVACAAGGLAAVRWRSRRTR
ncbi:Npun_F0296 family exosortase-dependent surface protein [Aquisphaera giovannonii]|nr:PEP-CTERM sorting domain-containing protein [Aquisphaera giovannonii]